MDAAREALAASPLLGVECSHGGRQWRGAPCDERLAATLSQRLSLPEMVGRVLAARGVGLDEAEGFLSPTLRAFLPDPSHLLDMDAAIGRLMRAVEARETIAILGDYDVDGATSSALLMRYFQALGLTVLLHVPDRMTEGYGPNEAALLGLHAKGATLAVTVDCGISAFQPLDAAAEAGLDVIVVDHHEAEALLPKAAALVDPNRLDETSPHGHMAAVGVAFLLVVALNRALRDAGYFKDRPAPDPMRWLDIVALGTVCDVVPLKGVNRALVTQGLKVMAGRTNPGIAALSDVCGVKERPEAFHCGYILGPRVNAGGRVGKSDLGARLLATEDANEAADLARRLDDFNRERQEIEAHVLLEAIEQVEGRPDDGLPLLIAVGEGWHPGVIGIVAGRLKERYNRASCVIAMEGGQGKASLRSVPGLDVGAAVIAARQAGLLVNGGGHAMAAGFTVAASRLEELRGFLGERLTAQLASPLLPVLELDGVLAPEGLTLDLVETLRLLAPFGAGNPEPRFAVKAARIIAPRVVGQGHVSFRIAGASGGRVKAIAFRAADSELGHALLRNNGTPMHLAGTLRPDHWQGETNVQFVVDDGAELSRH